MAALVQSGARRLVVYALLHLKTPAPGALIQRTQVSSPCLARLMSSTKQHVRRAPPETLHEALDLIQVKKERLYDLIAKEEAPDRQNRRLFKYLSTQIKPRPNDPRWRKTKALELFVEVTKSAIPLSGILLCALAMIELQSFKNAGNKEKQPQVDADAAATSGCCCCRCNKNAHA